MERSIEIVSNNYGGSPKHLSWTGIFFELPRDQYIPLKNKPQETVAETGSDCELDESILDDASNIQSRVPKSYIKGAGHLDPTPKKIGMESQPKVKKELRTVSPLKMKADNHNEDKVQLQRPITSSSPQKKKIADKENTSSLEGLRAKHEQAPAASPKKNPTIQTLAEKQPNETTLKQQSNVQTKLKKSINQFLEDQQNFLRTIEYKKQKLKNKLLEEQKLVEGTYKPIICKKSLEIIEKKKKQMETNLLKLGDTINKKSHIKKAVLTEESNSSSYFVGHLSKDPESLYGMSKIRNFVPKILKRSQDMKRKEKFDSILYKDAIRRQNKSVEYAKKPAKSPNTCKMSEESKKALAVRFIREFDIAIVDLLALEREPKLDYLQVNTLLIRLCFLKESEAVSLPNFTPERMLLYDLWHSLHGNEYRGIHRRNLLVFLLAVMGLNFIITKIKQSEQAAQDLSAEDDSFIPIKIQREVKLIGTFDSEGNYELTFEEVAKIRMSFNLWYVNKMSSPDNLNQMIKFKNIDNFTYTPGINMHSRSIANLYREKILETTSDLIQANKIAVPKDGKLTHADLLILAKTITHEKIEQNKIKLEDETLQECTFKPNIIPPQQRTNSSKKIDTKGHADSSDQEIKEAQPKIGLRSEDRCLKLYSLHKTWSGRKGKDPMDIEYEKNSRECTFQPSLETAKRMQDHMDMQKIPAKNIDKTIERMRSAQKSREKKMLQTMRGYDPTLEDSGLNFSLDNPVAVGNRSASKENKKLNKTRSRAHFNREPYTANSSSAKKQILYKQEQLSKKNPHPDLARNATEEKGKWPQPNEKEYEDVRKELKFDGHENEQKVPLLFVDVNLGQGKVERIVINERDKSEVLAQSFAATHGLDEEMTLRLKGLLDSHIASLLSRIDEEAHSIQSDADPKQQ